MANKEQRHCLGRWWNRQGWFSRESSHRTMFATFDSRCEYSSTRERRQVAGIHTSISSIVVDCRCFLSKKSLTFLTGVTTFLPPRVVTRHVSEKKWKFGNIFQITWWTSDLSLGVLETSATQVRMSRRSQQILQQKRFTEPTFDKKLEPSLENNANRKNVDSSDESITAFYLIQVWQLKGSKLSCWCLLPPPQNALKNALKIRLAAL